MKFLSIFLFVSLNFFFNDDNHQINLTLSDLFIIDLFIHDNHDGIFFLYSQEKQIRMTIPVMIFTDHLIESFLSGYLFFWREKKISNYSHDYLVFFRLDMKTISIKVVVVEFNIQRHQHSNTKII